MSATTINLLCSSLVFVLALGQYNWVLAVWCANAWFWTFITRQLIREIIRLRTLLGENNGDGKSFEEDIE